MGPSRASEVVSTAPPTGSSVDPTSRTAAASVASVAEAVSRTRHLLHGGRLLVASDFDGTLSHLVDDPWGARIIPAAQHALRRLAAAPHVHVAFISGRTVADLAARVRVGGASYRGDHGAEWAEAPRRFRPVSLRVEREAASPQEASLAGELARAVPEAVDRAWLVVERKGTSVTFHFRTAPDVADARRRVLEAVERVDPDGVLVRSGGRRALELRPPAASHKGGALRRLIDERRPTSALMLGDDPNDTLAFDVLRAAREAGEVDGVNVAVAGRADVIPGVAARADIALAGPAQAARLLAALAREAHAHTARGPLASSRRVSEDDDSDAT